MTPLLAHAGHTAHVHPEDVVIIIVCALALYAWGHVLNKLREGK